MKACERGLTDIFAIAVRSSCAALIVELTVPLQMVLNSRAECQG